jgi:transposase
MSCGGGGCTSSCGCWRSYRKQIDQVDQKLDALASEDDRSSCLQSVPGVGPRLSETVVAHIDDPHRFRTAAQVASYAGLVPKQMESGTVKRSGRITRRGPALLRSMLVEVAWMVYMRCDWAKRFVQRISGRRRGAEEDRDRGAGEEAAGDALGDAAGQPALC